MLAISYFVCVASYPTPGEKSCGQESKKGHAEKDVKSKWVAKVPAVDGSDNDDQVAKHYCYLSLASYNFKQLAGNTIMFCGLVIINSINSCS